MTLVFSPKFLWFEILNKPILINCNLACRIITKLIEYQKKANSFEWQTAYFMEFSSKISIKYFTFVEFFKNVTLHF